MRHVLDKHIPVVNAHISLGSSGNIGGYDIIRRR